jgi:hypothetical protein
MRLYRVKPVVYLAKCRFVRHPVRQFQKFFEEIQLQPAKRRDNAPTPLANVAWQLCCQHFLKLLIAAQGSREADYDYVYQFVPDVPVCRRPRQRAYNTFLSVQGRSPYAVLLGSFIPPKHSSIFLMFSPVIFMIRVRFLPRSYDKRCGYSV